MSNEELIKQADIQRIASEGAKIYEKIKGKFEPDQKGKFLAININNEDTFLGDTSSEAVELAKKSYPDEVFYVVKIGYSSVEILANLEQEHDSGIF